MKTKYLFLIACMLTTTINLQSQTRKAPKKILVAYFSQSGNTREVAMQIHDKVGGDIYEIQVEKPYPNDYNVLVEQAKKELQSNYKPALKTKIKNIRQYSTIIIGYPNWCNTFPAPIRTFLSEYDLSGKTIVPFCTYGGSGFGQSIADITKLCPKSNILEGLAVKGTESKNSKEKVFNWLQKIKLIN